MSDDDVTPPSRDEPPAQPAASAPTPEHQGGRPTDAKPEYVDFATRMAALAGLPRRPDPPKPAIPEAPPEAPPHPPQPAPSRPEAQAPAPASPQSPAPASAQPSNPSTLWTDTATIRSIPVVPEASQPPSQEVAKRKGSHAHRQRSKRRFLWRGLIALGVLVSLLLLAGAGFYVYANYRINQHGHKCSACAGPAAAAAGQSGPAPFNVLVMGSDSRAGLSPAEAKLLDPGNVDLNDGERADTIALLHVDPATGKAIVVSIPRDLWVPAPDGGYQKINSFFDNGPNSMVAEVSALTGLPIEHYVEVDFTSFGEIDQALGGVSVYFNRPIYDRNSGLHQPKGCNLLTGAQALAFVRDRDSDSDFGRIARQRLFVTLMINKILTAGTLLNPVKMANLINLGLGSLEHDSGLTLNGLLGLVKDFHNFSTSDIDFRVLPSYPNGALVDGQSVVDESTAEANALLTAIKNGTPLPDYGIQGVSPIQPSQVAVTVLDDTGSTSLARSAASTLRAKGYPVLSSGEATGDQAVTQTVVYYTPGSQTPAQYLQQQQFPSAALEPLPDGEQVYGNPAAVVVLGPDYVNPLASPSPGSLPSPSPGSSPSPGPTPSGGESPTPGTTPSPSASTLQPAGPAITIQAPSFGSAC